MAAQVLLRGRRQAADLLRQSLCHVDGAAGSSLRAFATAQEAVQLAERVVPRKLLIDGQWVASAEGKMLPVFDPSTEKEILQVSSASAVDVDKAVKAARKAFDHGPWPKMTAKERGKILFKLGDLLDVHREELAMLESLDNGKPLAISRAVDIPASADHIRYFAGWADKIHGKTLPVNGPYFAYTLHEPIGVIAQVIPWNFPLLMAAWKIAPALACGNTVVLKPAEQTPMTALRLGELALEAGLPPGVLNILTGNGPDVGAPLVAHNGVDKISFTGSTEIGRLIGKAAAQNIKPCTLELGGKSPVIVDRTVNVDQAVGHTHSALFFNAGQCCTAGSRTYVHAAVYDEFVEKSVAAAAARTVGDPFTSVDQGPQVDQEQFNKILGYVQKGQQEGAKLGSGGGRVGSKGFFVQPTVFTDVQDTMAISQEEIFGPVQCIAKFDTLEEVVQRANNSPYGLAAGVFSSNIDAVNYLTRSLKAGTVWVNTYNVFDDAVPFGGYKQSGIGRDKGEYALSHFTTVKAVYQHLTKPSWR